MKQTRGKTTLAGAAMQDGAGCVGVTTLRNANTLQGIGRPERQIVQVDAPIPVAPIAAEMDALRGDVAMLEVALNELSARLADAALSDVPDRADDRTEKAGQGASRLRNEIFSVRLRVRSLSELVVSLTERLEL